MAILSIIESGVCTIEIARPEKKNAFTSAMYREFAEFIVAAATDTAVHALLIKGQADIFSAGNDLEDFASHPPEDTNAPVFDFMRALMDFPKPVVAAVRGAAVGVGTTLLLHCDLVYVAEDTRLMMPFVSLGLVPEFGSSLLLPNLIGHVRAAESLLLGAPITGPLAVQYGIANKSMPSGEVLPHAMAAAQRFNTLPVQAVRETKNLLRRWNAEASRRAMDAEIHVFVQRLRSPEAQAAIKAFLSKRRA